MSYLFILLGVALLYFGGEVLVRYASALARRLGWSPLVIGLTVVAFGTSAPELTASMMANLEGAPDIALGNVVGSNTANLALILALAALIRPVRSAAAFLRRELPLLLGVTLAAVGLGWDGALGRVEGALFLAVFAAFLWVLLSSTRAAQPAEPPEEGPEEPLPGVAHSLTLALVGCGILVLGAESLVHGAVTLARELGVPERVIGLTMVAVGTSLPELASSVVAARRNESDIVLGNVVGSNLFNILLILGLTATAKPIVSAAGAAALRTDLLVMAAFTILVSLMLFRRHVARPQAATLLAGYGVYVGALYLN